jgi:hypothetical protein
LPVAGDRKPFRQPAEGLDGNWWTILDDLRNWMASEECRELAEAV